MFYNLYLFITPIDKLKLLTLLFLIIFNVIIKYYQLINLRYLINIKFIKYIIIFNNKKISQCSLMYINFKNCIKYIFCFLSLIKMLLYSSMSFTYLSAVLLIICIWVIIHAPALYIMLLFH